MIVKLKQCIKQCMMNFPNPCSAARKVTALIFGFAGFLLLFLLLKSADNISTSNRSSTITITPAPAVQNITGLRTKWIILSGYKGQTQKLCDKASITFPYWDTAVVTENRQSVYVCKTGVTRAVADLAYAYPSPELKNMPLLVASLLAIQEGAEAIYIPSKSWMTSNHTGIRVDKPYTGLISRRYTRVFTPGNSEVDFFGYRDNYGCVGHENVEKTEPLFDLIDTEPPAIQAPIGLAKIKDGVHNLCDKRAPPVSVSENVYVPNLQIEAALFMKRAFWALIFPGLLEGSVISKSTVPIVKMLLQKVLWSTGNNVMIWHYGNDHIATDLNDMNKLSSKTIALFSRLNNVVCIKNDVKSCLTKTLAVLGKQGYINNNVIESITGWYDALTLINIEPQKPIKKVKYIRRHVTFNAVDYSKKWYGRTKESNVPLVPVTNVKPLSKFFKQTCELNKLPKDISVNFTHPWEQFSDLLLMIVFNKVHYEIIPLLESMYRPIFPNIIYCGPGLPNSTFTDILKPYKLSFLNYQMTHRINVLTGLCNYECAAMGMQMHYNVDGYAIMGDDVLISIEKISKLPRDSAWFIDKTEYGWVDTYKQSTCNASECFNTISWPWWGWYRYASEATVKTMKSRTDNPVYQRCFNRLTNITGAAYPVFTGLSDFYYVPKRLATDFIEIAWLFRSYGVFLEITAPTILNCIEEPERLQQMLSTYLLTAEREKAWLFFNEDYQKEVLMHPTKWGPLLEGSVAHRIFYCYQVMPYLHDPLGRVR